MKRVLFGLAFAAACTWANADFSANFEPPAYAGSPGGTALPGQQGWILGPGASSPYFVYTYMGNSLQFAQNPVGQLQFVGAQALGTGAFPRAEHDHDFSTRDAWTITYYNAMRYNGVLPAANNLSSFSLQPTPPVATVPPTHRTLNQLNVWFDPSTATHWNATYMVFDAAGVGLGFIPGAAWEELPVNTWFKHTVTFDFTSNRITEVTITNVATGVTSRFAPKDWYLGGGSASTLPRPLSFRLFTGGGMGEFAGNASAWDGISIGAPPAPEVKVLPSSFSLFRGVLVGGDVTSLHTQDDIRLIVRPGVVLNQAERPIQVIVNGTANPATASSMTVRVESHANIPNIRQWVEAFNWTSSTYTELDMRIAPTSDMRLELSVPTPGEHINSSGQLRVRVSYKEAGPVFSYPWFARIDEATWLVAP